MYDVTHLFEARTGGYKTYRVPGILATDQDTILVTAEARPGTGGDWDSNEIIMRRSLDGGREWLEPQIILGHDAYGPGPISNFVMIADGPRVHALFCHNYERIYSCGRAASAQLSVAGHCHRPGPWHTNVPRALHRSVLDVNRRRW